MRVAGTILSLSLLVSAAPAFAQGGSYYDRSNWYNRQSMAQDGQGYISPEQQHLQSPPTYPGDWQQQSYGQQNYGGQNYGGQSYGQQPPSPYWQTQPGSMQQGMQSGYPSLAIGLAIGSVSDGPDGSASFRPGIIRDTGPIRSSLEASGFKNVTVLPQSYLIRATAPDGSQVVMQVSSDGVYGVVVNSTDQASSSGTGGASTGGTSSSTGNASASTGGTSGHRRAQAAAPGAPAPAEPAALAAPAAAPEVSAPQTQAALGAQAAAPAVSAPAAAAKPAAPGLGAAAAPAGRAAPAPPAPAARAAARGRRQPAKGRLLPAGASPASGDRGVRRAPPLRISGVAG